MNRLILLDSHVLLWWMERSPKIGPQSKLMIEEADRVYVSAATAWELNIKHELKKLRLPEPVGLAVRKAGFIEIPVGMNHAEGIAGVKLSHKDPFDRLIVSTAQIEGLELLTSDRELLGLPGTFNARL